MILSGASISGLAISGLPVTGPAPLPYKIPESSGSGGGTSTKDDREIEEMIRDRLIQRDDEELLTLLL